MDKISRVCGIDPFNVAVSAGNGFPRLHFVPTLQHAGTKRLLSIDHKQIIPQPCNVR